ncbi:RNA polymerase sigma-70 factor [Chitinophaga arvensicola]|uniref:RNA polymerase sigma-70 factor, ECF subfamily n=1 Tax=Chitinophaga arvensicola TaxID=29529 RepID=A0A1I0RB03_9BACT|nr:RNA polymerase sigma-70 factor [Chitinophaga arvensicola]SEW37810.1 RNA polymerase sigma-70 factor, ECF subfamily [Chitinophaga arvensicola]
MSPNSDHSHVLSAGEFERLFRHNHQFLCVIAARIIKDDVVAKDLVQDFFIKYWENRHHLHVASFEAYAYRAVNNSCIDYLRRQEVSQKRHAGLETDVYTLQPSDEMPAEDKRLNRLLQLFNQLPPERRRVFELHVQEGLTYREIALQLNISVNTVKTQLRRAYTALRGKIISLLVLLWILFLIFF